MSTKLAVVIPCYRVQKKLLDVVVTLPSEVQYIIIVDDFCPHKSFEVLSEISDSRLIMLHHEFNQGVGGAMVTGYKKALELGAEICIKIDGDGQMDPVYIPKLIEPLINNQADYTKGNRFKDFVALKSMPKIRLFGNSVLSFLVKVASGYWNIMDPTNGYTAIHRRALEELDLDTLSKRYFFESDMLIQLNTVNAVVKDIPIPARYGDEESSLKVRKILFDFPPKLLKGFFRRIGLKYFIYDFNMASIYTLFGLPMVLWGLFFGAYRWYLGAFADVENTTGTVMLSVLPLILGVQFLIAAINIDINNIPKKEKT